ncbi:MAG TPA: sulfatase-like hydrolase/transferase [Thermoanaerobaculia bacterium]
MQNAERRKGSASSFFILRSSFCVLVFLLALTACTRPEAPAAPPADLPIFLISIDTLRSDRVNAQLTPQLTALAQDGVTFTRAFSHVPQTLPSHTTMLTGLLPQHNGVRDNIGYAVAPSLDTLPEILKRNGYTTGASVSSYVLRRATGIDQGFDFFDDELEYRSFVDIMAERGGERSVAALQRWLDGVTSRKLFAFLHLYEPHAPYANDSYDADVQQADAIVGSFLADLKRRNLYDDALVIVTSDHGEGLGEHGEDEHGVFLYREAIQVPLIIKLPRRARAGERIETMTALADLTPTILTAAGFTPPKVDGLDALGAVPPARRIYAESYYPRLHINWHELTSLVDAQHQYIDAPRRELYDWRADPREQTNLLDTNRRVAFAMAGELKPLVTPFQPPSNIDLEDQRKLAALGYLGSASPTPAGPLPDPKDRIHFLRILREAKRHVTRGEFAAAIPLLRKLTEENPSLVDEWVLLAEALERSRQRGEAIAVLRRANALFPGSAVVTLPLAELYLADRRFADARAHAELALKEDEVLAREMLAKIALAANDLPTAKREIERAAAVAPKRTTTLLALARVQKRAEEWGALLGTLDRIAAEIDTRHLPRVRGLHADRGEALLHLQRGREAEQAFRRETELFPDNLPAWGNLAVILSVQGRNAEARALLDDAVRRNPTPEAQRMRAEALTVVGR